MKSTEREPFDTGTGIAGVRMRTVVAVSFFIHLLILSVISTDGITGDDKKKKYISVDIIRKSLGFDQARPAEKPRSSRRIETAPQRESEHTESKPETGMSMTPQIAPQNVTESAVVSGNATAGPASTNEVTVYHGVHKLSKLPLFRKQVKPVYPVAERNAGKEARVVVEVYINTDGSVAKVELIKSGGPAFDEAATEAAKASSFEPGCMDGRQVAVKMQIPYVFRLR